MDRRKMAKERGQGGFTLVELLVVIAIIALLLAILMPTLNKVRKQAESLICKTHLKEISRLAGLYAYDNNGRMVPSPRGTCRWYDLIGDYYYKHKEQANAAAGKPGSRYNISVFKCPVEEKKDKAALKRGDASLGAATMYSGNIFFMCRTEDNGTPNEPSDDYVMTAWQWIWFSKIDKIKQPSTLPVFYDNNTDTDVGPDTYGYPHISMYKFGWDSTGSKRAPKSCQTGASINHLNGINYLFADMHVENMGNWPYNLSGTGRCSGRNISWATPGTGDDYFIFWHPLRKLYISGTSGTRTPGDGFPGGLPIR